MASDPTTRLIDANDLDGLLRRVDELCALAAWDDLCRLRDAARAAHGGGRQLWPAALHAEYRLALEAPGPWAAPVVVGSDARFSVGPLTEVVASTHTWDQLAPHLAFGPARALVAYERVLRGENLQADRSIDRSVFDLPLRIQSWEPAYPTATYEAWRGIFPTPPVPQLQSVRLPDEPPAPLADPSATEALNDLTRTWVTESNGRADAVAVQGDVFDAIAALGVPGARVSRISAADALAVLAWTGASGGAHGRRRGMAAGRFGAWWAAAALTAMTDDWPVEADELGEAVAELGWFAWDTEEPPTGWTFRIAVVDPAEGMAWAAMANDQRLS
jgi:Family of unknown function (DUF6183)